ncbi:uncharacterized protein LOC107402114 isoform X1 [Peromyscus maniculatus bairdii]|uniref:uncharacterized protein LOC107402114 isoform X1 n=1 Tax=Peromyscus maniculatus bairdii TaxID=230844 RepID=UPI003FCF20BA
MRRRRRLRWGAVGREAADQCGEEFTRGGACRGSPSSVESRAQRALCTPAAGARSRELGAHGRGDPVHTNPQVSRPGASSAASNRMHLRTHIATSLSMVTTHPRGGTALAPQPRQVGPTLLTRMAWSSQRSICFCLPRAGIKGLGLHLHAWL